MAVVALLLLASAATAPAPALHTRDVLAARGLVWAGRTDGLAVLDLADPLRPQSVARLSVKSPVLGSYHRTWTASSAKIDRSTVIDSESGV